MSEQDLSVEARALAVIERFEATIATCRAEDGEDYGKPNVVDEDGTERFEPCEHCTERAAAVEVIRALQARIRELEG